MGTSAPLVPPSLSVVKVSAWPGLHQLAAELTRKPETEGEGIRVVGFSIATDTPQEAQRQQK